MIDPSNGAQVRQVNGTTFRRLSSSGWIKLGNSLMVARKDGIADTCARLGDDHDTATRLLNEHDSRMPKQHEVINYVTTPAGTVESVRLALCEAGKPDATNADVDALGLSMDGLFLEAVWLMNLRTAGEKAEKMPPDPTLGSEASASSSDTPTSSA